MRSKTTDQVYLFVKDYIEKHTHPPSLREIGEGCYMSTSAVTRHLERLEGQGKLFRTPGKARGITLGEQD